jgi:hypothetical protein
MRHVLAAVLYQFNNCHPEAAESRAQASDSQRRISALRGQRKQKWVPHFSRSVREMGQGRDKNDYRGILAGLEGTSGKKAVDSKTMTVDN